MHGRTLYIGSLLLASVLGGYASPLDVPTPDPLQEVIEALSQGRHWYAARLLRRLSASQSPTPGTVLLAARADAGRANWAAVARRLEGAAWLDSVALGEGRALLARGWLEIGQPEHAIRNYRIYLDYAVERLPRAMAEIRLARALTSTGDAVPAADAFSRAAELLPELEYWLAIRAAEALAAEGDTASVRSWIERAEAIPSWRRAIAHADAYRRAGDPAGAVTVLLSAANDRSNGAAAADLRARTARIQLEEGDTSAARTQLRIAVRLTPSAALEAADLLSMLPGLEPEDHLRLARAYEKASAPGRAVPEYRAYMSLRRLPKIERQRLQLKIGELLFQTGSNAAAIENFTQLIASKPAASLATRAEYLIARATYRRGQRTRGRQLLQAFADRYPGTGSAIVALALLGDLYESSGNSTKARQLYERLAARYPWTTSAGRARFRLGILAFQDGDYTSARRHFDLGRRRYRRHDLYVQATYWAARARLVEGGPEALDEAERLLRTVHTRDPFGYYGLLAAERIRIDAWANLPAGPQAAPIDPKTRNRLAIIQLLQQAGLDDEVRAVLDQILSARREKPAQLLGLSYALLEQGFGREAVRLGWRVHAQLKGRWSASVLKAIYPLGYPDIILAESRARRLEPHLLAALARQESAFDPEVTSRAGARGLLQLMPQTGRQWADRLGLRDYREDMLFHPEINVHLGAAYFADLARRYREMQIALVAYNAGPTRARRWRKRPAYRIDSELFAERIPLSETRGYVQSIQTQLRIYRQLYSEFGSKEAAAGSENAG